MADDLQAILNGIAPQAPSQAPVSVKSGAGEDELARALNEIAAPEMPAPVKPALPPVVNLPSAAQDALPEVKQQEEAQLRGILDSVAPQEGYLGTLGSLFSGGVKRNVAQFASTPDMLGALYNESQGNLDLAREQARKAIETQNAAGQPVYDLSKIHSAEDFSYWLAEKLGENAATMAAMLFTGGLGGLTFGAGMKMIGEKALLKAGTVKSLQLAGAMVPAYALTTGLETAGTGAEIFESTGKLTPRLALGAGSLKGALEIWGPLSIAKSLISPGKVLGKSIPGAIAKTAGKESATEFLQESIDISARMMMDPEYSFFKAGATNLLDHPGIARLAEAGAAGLFTGGIYGAPFAKAEAARARTEDGNKVQKPGDRVVIPGDPAKKGDPNYVEKIADALAGPSGPTTMPQLDFTPTKGPITSLRDLIFKPDSTKWIDTSGATNKKDDSLGLGPLLRTEGASAVESQLWDRLDAAVPRYVIRNQDGTYTTDVLTDTELELDNVVNYTQDVKPDYHQIETGSLVPAHITARVQDLPDPETGHVWVLPGVKPEERARLLEEYKALYGETKGALASALMSKAGYKELEAVQRPKYEALLNRGLRAVPSRGAGFYYAGPMKAQRVDVTKSQRGRQVGLYDPVTGEFSAFTGGLEGAFAPYNRNAYLARTMPDLFQGRIPVSLDLNKLEPGSFREEGSKRYFIKKLDLTKVTPGVDMSFALRDDLGATVNRVEFTPEILKTGVYNKFSPYDDYAGAAREFETILKDLSPAVDKILQDLGIEYSVTFQVTDEMIPGGSAAWVWMNGGIIAFNPKVWLASKQLTTGDLKTDIRLVAMHELGHMVTMYYWSRLPLERQGQLLYAWEKAALARRMDYPGNRPEDRLGDGRALNPIGVGIGTPESNYYNGLIEWLAEQFRRWTEYDPQAVNWQDEALKGGSEILEKFYKRWEEATGKDTAVNLRRPDYYFSALMQYLRDYGSEKKAFLQRQRQTELYFFSSSLSETPALLEISRQVELAIRSMEKMFPREVAILVSERLDGDITDGPFQSRAQLNLENLWKGGPPYVELAMGALPGVNTYAETRESIAHELMHALEVMGLITPAEITVLDQAIARGPDPLAGKEAAYRATYRRQLEDDRTSPTMINNQIELLINRERRAFYLQEFANTGIARDEPSKKILARLLEVLERIKNFIQGLGYQSRDDVIRAIFKGEIARRSGELSKAELRNALRVAEPEMMPQLDFSEWMFDKIEQVDKYTVGVGYDGGSASTQEGKLGSKYISYVFFNPNGSQAGFVDLKNKMPKGFEVEMIQTKGGGFGLTFMNYIEQDLGIPMKLAGILLEDGFQQGRLFARKRAGIKDLGEFYKPVTRRDGTVQYYSPNKVQEMIGLWTRIVKMMQTPEGVETVNQQFADVLKQMVNPAGGIREDQRMTQKRAVAILAGWLAFKKKFPPEVWNDPRLEHMFQLERNVKRDGVQGASISAQMEQDGEQLLGAMANTGRSPGYTARELYEEKLQRYKAQTAAEMGWDTRDVGAPMVQTMQMLEGFKKAWSNVAPGIVHEKMGTHPERLNKHLAGQVKTMDRMNAFWKWTLTLKQIAQKNPHLAGLRDYVDHDEIMKQITMKWVRRAEETAKAWEQVGAAQREAISKTMFDLTEMKYRTSQEVSQKVVRQPAGWLRFLAGARPELETEAIFKANKVSQSSWKVIRRVGRDFQDFLTEVENLRKAELAKTFATNPNQLQVALLKLASEMGDLRAKPYFPMMRFGQFTIAVRDSATGKIIWASAYDNQTQRDRAVEQVQAQFPGEDITIGRASEAASEFMGLPGPLLRLIREKMNADPSTALTPEQMTWLEEFEVINGVDTTFAKRWLPAQGTPGYSQDAFRAYASYFQSGSRYIARLAKMDDMKEAILAVQNTFARGGIANSAKRQMIVDYMRAHFKYVMEPGQDNGKLRAFVSLWFLGFSVPSAFLNLTQIPLMSIPYLGKQFGNTQAYGALVAATNSLKNTQRLRSGKTGLGNQQFLKAREEAISQGVIDVGQAAELGAFAEGHNLNKLLAGDKTAKLWKNLSYWGMYMFGYVEQFNRELTFSMAWNLAMKNPNAPRVSQIDAFYIGQVSDLIARTGMTHQEAVAFLFAKETVERTQFSYDKSADPQFMRGKKKDLFIFFKYMQNALFTMSHNGGSMFLHVMIWYMALYGLMGLPGSEDLNELVRLLAKRFFGKDMDVHKEAREFVRDLTRGTVFDKTGPDLFMHGISRYGLGPSLFTEHYWPAFDVSANGSMGRIIPGFAELAHGMATNKKWADIFADSAQKASGAAYGMVFPLMKYLSEPPGTVDSKKWEQLLPRFTKGFTKAYRHGFSPGAETDSTGAKLVSFDVTDPGDLMTVITTALGFQPRKVNETYEFLRATRDVMDTYQARRVALYAQMDKALLVGDSQVIADVLHGFTVYNQEVIEAGFPNLALKTSQIMQSLKQRIQGRAMQENFLARNRSQIPVSQKMMDLFPGVLDRKVK